MFSHPFAISILVCLSILPNVRFSSAQTIDQNTSTTVKTYTFATIDEQVLKLDLWKPVKPAGVSQPPLLVWVHGGAWRAGSRATPKVLALVDMGWAVASIDYRLSTVAKFPAQVHDIKAAIRFLRENHQEHGCAVEKIAIAGASAGGHLAALVGVTNGHAELEGKVGADLDADSSVQAIVSLYGASNLQSILSQSTPHGLSVRVPALELLLGAGPEKVPKLAQLASPIAHVDPSDPPLLLIHGDQDPQMPINQAHELQGAYKKNSVDCQFTVLHGAAHGGEVFYDAASLTQMDDFLRSVLKVQGSQ
ncbi:MAG: acetyl esterase/lipase [Verrucomicrobiales bacterium]|jgi:acetyl esterase/lipase